MVPNLPGRPTTPLEPPRPGHSGESAVPPMPWFLYSGFASLVPGLPQDLRRLPTSPASEAAR